MAEPFKNLLNEKNIKGMARHFKKHWPQFDSKGFIAAATDDLDTLELKQRNDRITETMIDYLPDDFEKVGKIMLASLGTPLGDDISAGEVDKKGIAGWAITPMTYYVGLRGHEHFDLSMLLLKEMSKRASSEFGIRYFLSQSPKKTLSVLKKWVSDSDPHVRRLVSEGSRPRLPWAMQLPIFIKNPAPVIELLERLKDDDKEYVRRSVANNLNDIAKDHPDLVADISSKWLKEDGQSRKKLVRHACRTLVKNGHKKTLRVLGFKPANLQWAKIDILTPKVIFGDALQFGLSICSAASREQNLLIDYIIHHRKANGTTSPKVFKWRTLKLAAGQSMTLSKCHNIRKITTRVYYPGRHEVEIMVNGTSVAKAGFHLLMQ